MSQTATEPCDDFPEPTNPVDLEPGSGSSVSAAETAPPVAPVVPAPTPDPADEEEVPPEEPDPDEPPDVEEP